MFRFSLLRPAGWTRLGMAAAVGILFGTPMLWALGAFGPGDDARQRALIFLLAGIWFCVGLGYTVGWAIGGFTVKVREAGEDERDAPPRPGAAAHAAPHAPPHPPQHPPSHVPPPHRPPSGH